MSELFLWNFQCIARDLSTLDALRTYKKDDIKWEARFFWPRDENIVLGCVDSAMLSLKNYHYKQKEDHYFLLDNTHENIKLRRNTLLYKPQLHQSTIAIGFGPKINLEDKATYPPTMDSQALQRLLQDTQNLAQQIQVTKESYLLKLNTKPHIKLELAKLKVYEKTYFSLCIEGKSLPLVEYIARAIVGDIPSCDYITFLKSMSFEERGSKV